ncbi:MAG: accessory factor UbiK family protein [Hyphomicrobiales bacterium]|nr:accessory factor UbiK family protein [Hyphomicrobiales bacterium]
MQEPRSRLADDLNRLFNDAAGLAGGLRREVETLVRTQMERMLSKMDVVSREEFEAARDMAALAREQNEKLEKRIADLEARIGKGA